MAAESDVKGIDVNRVTEWFEAHVPDARPPLSFEACAGGHSTLTYKVTDASGRCRVLRRPPLHHALATAHDMAREHRIIAALGKTAVPVAPAIGYCADPAVTGAPFYVMGFVPGTVLHDTETALAALAESHRRR